MKLWDIAIEAPFLKPLSYLQGQLSLKRGLSVFVPLGHRTVSGVVLGPSSHVFSSKSYKWKKVLSIRTDRPPLSESYLKWMEWLSHYYVYPIGEIFKTTFPPLKQSQRKSSNSFLPEDIKPSALTLSPAQEAIVDKMNQKKGFQVHVLHGVTGSGKTEVYLGLIDRIIPNKQVLVIVPEISLTPQLVERFVKKFGQNVAVLHSMLTNRERTNQWWDVMQQKKPILIGARSAIFCPIKKLGLIVVDEEHEASFKQWERLHYNARDASVMLAKQHACPVVLGSATPSLETWHNACEGKYHLHQLALRFGQARLPHIIVEDMTQKKQKDPKLPFWFESETLYKNATTSQSRSSGRSFSQSARRCTDSGLHSLWVLCDVSELFGFFNSSFQNAFGLSLLQSPSKL